MALSDLADWWDKQKAESEHILTDWVQENPQWWAVGIAATLQTTMDVGAGTVDVLRFGQGAAKGGWKGYGQDALRLLVLIGPLARGGAAASRVLTPLAQSGRLRLAVQLGQVEGPCTFQAVNNALSITKGRNAFVTAKDMAAAMGKQLSQIARNAQGDYKLAAWIDDLVPFLRQIGVRVKEVKGLQTIAQVESLAVKESGPVIFAIRTTVKTPTGAVEEILHSVIAMRTPGGAVRFADYGGKYVNSLRELVSQWGSPVSPIELLQAGSSATIINGATLTGEFATKIAKGAIIVIEGMTAIETTENGVELAVPVTTAASTAPAKSNPVEPDVIKGSLGAYKARASGRPVIKLPPIYISAGKKNAPKASYLTGVQYRLNALGFGAGPVDGVMGPRTRKAVNAFQATYPPLAKDGIPGPKTQSKLVEICGY